MLFVYDYELVNTLEHFYEAALEHMNILHRATHLNYLLVAEEVKARKLLSLVLNVLF